MRSVRALVLAGAVGALALMAAPMGAQQSPPPQRQGGLRPGAPAQNRQALERQVRIRIQRVMRDQLALTDEQLGQLDRTMRGFEDRRRALLREERQLRLALRGAMGAAASGVDQSNVDQAAVARALDSLIVLQRRRIDLIQEEQRELAQFLTPLQRARFFALQDNLRRMLDEGAGPPGGSPRPGVRHPGAGQGAPPPERR